MAKLRRFTLSKDKDRDDWVLREQGATRARKRYATKGEALTAGALAKALGEAGGSVRIKKENGRIQQERTFPRARDPKGSAG
ncbi:MAG: DUF2188 domain-containing protein [Alphaproteobacteria bacterium]